MENILLNEDCLALSAHSLGKSFGDFTLGPLDFALPTGCIMGLVGENGAGKSTLIRLIMNALQKDTGTVQVLGQDIESPQFTYTKEEIGVVLSETGLPSYLSARQINRVMRLTYKNWDEPCFISLLKDFNLPEEKKFKDFSTGMKMKLALAVALAHKARLLILDEPTAGLDPMIRDDILNRLNEYTRDPQNTVLISSHIVSDLEKICDYISFLHQGRLLFCEEKDRLLEDYAILKLSEDNFASIPPQAIIAKHHEAFSWEVLVKKEEVNGGLIAEHSTLEDIIIFWAKGDKC